MKYVVFESDSLENMVIFPEHMNHTDIRATHQYGAISKPIRAGFCNIKVDKHSRLSGKCYGMSISLVKESDPEKDSELLKKLLKEF